MEKRIVTKISILFLTILGISSCSSVNASNVASTSTQTQSNSRPYNTALLQGNAADVWNNLQHTSIGKLLAMKTQTDDAEQKAWIQLAIISKRNSANTEMLANELLQWRKENPTHIANALLPDNNVLTQLQTSSTPKQIALLLPARGTFAASGQSVRAGFLNAYYKGLSNSKSNVKFYDTSKSANLPTLYQQAVSEGADLIIGPLLKENVQQLQASNSFPSTTLALNYSQSSTTNLPTNFYQFGLLPEDEAAQLADRAHLAGSSRALIIAPDTLWGKRLASAFSARWQTLKGQIKETYYFGAKADLNQGIARLLKVETNADDKKNKNQIVKRREDFDVVFLFAKPQQARSIVPLLRFYTVKETPIYATSTIYSGKPNPIKDNDLNGVTVCDIPLKLQTAKVQTSEDAGTDRLYAVGQDAYLLSQNFSRLKDLPNFPIYGTTGALTLSNNHQIHRRLPCATIKNGYL